MRLFSRPRVLALSICAILIAVFYAVLRPGPANSLIPYKSPPITVAGKRIVVQILVPEGWRVRVEQGGSGPMAPRFFELITASSNQRMAWMPAIVRRLLVPDKEPRATLSVYVGTQGSEKDGKTHHRRQGRIKGDPNTIEYVSWRGLPENGGSLVTYRRTDQESFDKTFREVCDSFNMSSVTP
jgi:hypothetical protein